jgi:uncharacterized membrane protein YedE/YeeE
MAPLPLLVVTHPALASTPASAKALVDAIVGGILLLIGSVLLVFCRSRPTSPAALLPRWKEPKGSLWFFMMYVLPALFLAVVGLGVLTQAIPKLWP